MITFDVNATGLTRSRFAISRLAELGNALEVLALPGRAPYARRWANRVRRRVDRSSVAVLLALVEQATWYVPDFLAPYPDHYEPALEEELAAVAATPSDEVRSQLEMAFQIGAAPPEALEVSRSSPGRDPRPPLPTEVARVLDQGGTAALTACLADQLRYGWKIVLAESWDLVRRVVDGDVRHHATRASRAGLAEIFDDVHPGLTWNGTQVELDHASDIEFGEASALVLTPSVFLLRPVVWLATPNFPVVGYPARGRGKVWSTPASLTGPSNLLGLRRTALLTDLDTPRTTTELAARHGLSAATVSYHLRLLHQTGLVARHQAGRAVLYERTERATDLLAAVGGLKPT